MTFEEKLARLEEISKILEEQKPGLDDSLKLYEEAQKLQKDLNEELTKAMNKLSYIIEDGEIKPYKDEEAEKEI